MTPLEAAKALGVSRQRVYLLLAQGRLTGRKDGRFWVHVDPMSVERFTRLPSGRPRKGERVPVFGGDGHTVAEVQRLDFAGGRSVWQMRRVGETEMSGAYPTRDAAEVAVFEGRTK